MNRPLLDRSAAVAMATTSASASAAVAGGNAGAMADQSAGGTLDGKAALPGAPAARRGGSLDNFDTLKSSLLHVDLQQAPASTTCASSKNNNYYANANSKSPPSFPYHLADETSRRIDQILLRSSSTPATASSSAATTTASRGVATTNASYQGIRPSVQIQTRVYRRAAARLGLRLRSKDGPSAGSGSASAAPSKSAMAKSKRQANDIDNDCDTQTTQLVQNPMKKRKTVTFRPTATLSTIERISPSESKAMHRTSEESRMDQDRTIQNARDLRNLCMLYSHEDAGTIRSIAQCLQIDTCTRGVEHYLSQEVYEERRLAAMRVVDTVLQTQAHYQQRRADADSSLSLAGVRPSPSLVDDMTNDIALASARLSQSAAIDAMNRGAEDEAATRT